MAEQNLIKKYVAATAEKRVDIIIKNYTKFIGIVDGYKEKTLSDIADEQGITYEPAQQRMHKNKLQVKKQVIRFMAGNPGGIA